jgi:hypothetical protein
LSKDYNYTCGCGSENISVVDTKKRMKLGCFVVMPIVFLVLYLVFFILFGSADLIVFLIPFLLGEVGIYTTFRKSKKYQITCQDCLNNTSIENLDEIENA